MTNDKKTSIAVVGMAGLFPGASDLNTFWQNIVDKVDTACEVPRGRWIAEPDFMVHPEKYENAFQGMMALQWFTALFTFVLGSWAYLHYIEKRSISELNVGEAPNWKIFLWAILTILVSMPFLEYVIQLNQNLILPAGFEELESWMKTSEQNMAQLTKFLLNFTSPTDFAIAIAVIGGMAALGEEIF